MVETTRIATVQITMIDKGQEGSGKTKSEVIKAIADAIESAFGEVDDINIKVQDFELDEK